jgi:cytochrome P450
MLAQVVGQKLKCALEVVHVLPHNAQPRTKARKRGQSHQFPIIAPTSHSRTMNTILLIASLLLAFVLYCAVRTVQAYLAVRNCGFPVWVSPVDQGNPFLIAFGPLIMKSQVLRRILPSKLWRVLDLSIYGYEWRDQVAGRARQPPGYVIVHGGSKIDVYIEDPELASAVLGKRRDFPMDPIAMQFLGIVGPNLSSTEGEDWQRQRRLIAPLLNERIMDTVWTESCEQANDMVGHFMTQGGETNGTVEGLRRIAFNILSCIGYGQPQKWNEVKKDVPPGHKFAYMDALHRLIEGFILLALTPSTKLMQLPIMPAAIRGYADALDEFHIYTRDLLQKEAQIACESDEPRNSFLSLLATISDQSSGKTGPLQGEKQTLSEAEIEGNLYQFTLAGWDTTCALPPTLLGYITDQL